MEQNPRQKKNKQSERERNKNITGVLILRLPNLKAAPSSNLNGNVIAQRSHLLKKCNRVITPESFKKQEKKYYSQISRKQMVNKQYKQKHSKDQS